MNQEYQRPEMEVIVFEHMEVITTSGGRDDELPDDPNFPSTTSLDW